MPYRSYPDFMDGLPAWEIQNRLNTDVALAWYDGLYILGKKTVEVSSAHRRGTSIRKEEEIAKGLA